MTTPLSADVFVARGSDKTTELYQLDPTTFSLTKVFSENQGPSSAAISPGGATIFLASGNTLKFIDSTTFQVEKSLAIPFNFLIVPSPDGRRLYLGAAVGLSTYIDVLDLQTDKIVGSFPADIQEGPLVVSPDSSTIYFVNKYPGGEFKLEQVSASTLAVTNSIVVPESLLNALIPLAISPDGSTLAIFSSTTGYSITLLSLPSLTVISANPSENVCGLAFTSKQLVETGCGADTLDVVDITSQKVLKQLDAGPSPQTALSVAQGQLLFVYNTDGVWAIETKTGKILNQIDLVPGELDLQSDGFLSPLALSADRKTLFAVSATGVAEISTATTQLLGYVPGIPAGSEVQAIATSSALPYLFVGLINSLLIIDQTTGALIGTYAIPNVYPSSLIASSDGSTVYIQGFTQGTSLLPLLFSTYLPEPSLLRPLLIMELAQRC